MHLKASQTMRHQILWSLVWKPCVTVGGNQAALVTRPMPSLQWSVLVASCWGIFFSSRNWETFSQDRGKDECCIIQRLPGWKPAPERSWPQTGAMVHRSAGQQQWAHSQDMKGEASRQLCEGPGAAEPEARLESDWTSLNKAAKRNGPNCLTMGAPSWWHHLQKVGASAKYWSKAVNTYLHLNSVFFIFNKFAKIYLKKKLFSTLLL